MTAPIASAGPVPGDAAGTTGAAAADRQDGGLDPFEAMLGAAMALPATQPVATGDPAVPPPALDLTLDGSWMLDEPVAAEAPAKAAESVEPVATSTPSADDAEPVAPAITLEKDLDDWVSRITRRGPAPDGASPSPAGSDVAPVPAEEADSVSVSVTGALAASAAGSIAVAAIWQPEAPITVESLAAPAESDPPVADSEPARPEPPVADGAPTRSAAVGADDLIKRLAPFHRAVEIGGFSFPTDQTDTLTVLPADPAAVGLDFGDGDRDRQAAGGAEPQTRPALDRAPVEPAKLVEAGNRLADLLLRANREVVRSSRSGPDEPERRKAEPPTPGPTSPGPLAALAGHRSAEPTPKPAGGGALVAAPKTVGLDPVGPPIRRPDHITLDLADEAGDHGRLRLSLSGPNVRATILPNDPVLAGRLTVGIRELRQALEDRGFPEPRVTVQSPKAEGPTASPSLGRDVVAELRAPASRPDARGGGNDDARNRWQPDQADRQWRDRRAPDRRPHARDEEGGTE